MNEQIREISIQLKRDLQALYGERLKGLMLFGSYARGEASLESDVDFLLILNGVFDAWEEIEQTGGGCFRAFASLWDYYIPYSYK